MHRRPTRHGGGEDNKLVVVLDCLDLDRTGAFWCAALGYVGPPAEWQCGPYRQLLPADRDGIELLLQRVPEGHGMKNRVHLDLRTPDVHPEVARHVGLGASQQTCEPIEERVGVACVVRPGWERTPRPAAASLNHSVATATQPVRAKSARLWTSCSFG